MNAQNTALAANTDRAENIVGHFINGQHVVDYDRTADVANPATGAITKQVALASKQTVEQVIAAAQTAFPAWRNTPPLKRARIMFRFKELLESNANKAAAMITDEHGKVLDDAMGEFGRGVEVVEYACGAPEFLKGEHSKNAGPDIDSWSEMQPLVQIFLLLRKYLELPALLPQRQGGRNTCSHEKILVGLPDRP